MNSEYVVILIRCLRSCIDDKKKKTREKKKDIKEKKQKIKKDCEKKKREERVVEEALFK